MLVTAFCTVTVQVAVLFVPSEVFAVIVAVPVDLAVTTPLVLTVATLVLLLVHVTVLLLVSLGVTVATNVSVVPASRVVDDLFKEIPVANLLTVTVHVAFLLVLPVAVAVIVTVPTALGVTTPSVLTVATLVLLLDHVTPVFEAFDGVIVATRVSVLPIFILVDVLFKDIPVTG